MVFLPIGNKDYGFRDARPSGRVFAVTGDYASDARNHCAATMLTNLVIMLRAADPQLHNQAAVGSCNKDMQQTFRNIHAIVGNGPVLHLQNKANRYLRSAGLPYSCEQIDRHLTETSPDRLVQIAQDHMRTGAPVALLVAASPLRWHWVLALPDYGNDHAFMIHDSWHARQVYHYIPDRGSRLMAICVFTPNGHAI